MTASPNFQLSSDGGSSYSAVGTPFAYSTALAYNAAGSYSIKARLDSTADVVTATWTLINADADSIASLPTVTTNADKTCTFSVPKQGGAWLLRCTVTDGTNTQRSSTLKISVKVSNGNELIAVGEQYEASTTYGWNKVFNDSQKAGGAGTLGGDVTGAAGANTVEKIQNLAVSVAGIAAGKALVSDGTGFETSTNFRTNVVQAGGYQAPTSSPFSFSSAAVSYASDANKTLSSSEYNCHDLTVTSAVSLTATRNLVVPLTAGGTWRVYNGTTGAQSIQVIGSSGTGVTIANGQWGTVRANGTNVVSVAAAGAGGSTPTGTGLVHITGGVQDGASSIGTADQVMVTNGGATDTTWAKIANANVDAAAAIVPTKLSLGSANTVIWSDGATNAWTSLPIVSRVDVTSSYRVNGTHALGFSGAVLKLGNQTTWTSLLHDVSATCTYDYAWGGSTYLTMSQSAAALSIAPATAAASVTIQQSDTTAGSATGAPTVIGAQWATGATSTGGAISVIAGYSTSLGGAALLRGGDATTTGGAAQLRGGDGTTTGGAATIAAGTGATNGAINFSWGSSPIIIYSKSSNAITALAVAATTSLTHGYTDLGTNSATGGILALRGQTCTGTTSTGGDVRMGPGGGTSRPGDLYLAFGTTDLVKLSYSTAYTWNVDAAPTSVLWQQTGASGAGTGALWSIASQDRTSGTGGELRLKGGSGSGSSTHGAVTFYIGGSEVGRFDTSGVLNAKKITGLSGNAFAYSVLDKDVSASGTITLSSSEYNYHDINLYGTITAATTVVLPSTAGGSWRITNNATGAFAVAVQISGGRLYYIGKAQTETFRCDGSALYTISEKAAVMVLSEGIIDYNGTSGTNTDTTIYSISANVSALITGVELYLDTAQTGATSVCTMTVGNTAGGTQWIVSQTINTATAAGTAYGLATTDLGSNFDATKGYVYYSNRTSGSIIVRCARSVATVTAGKLRYRVLGMITG